MVPFPVTKVVSVDAEEETLNVADVGALAAEPK